MTQAATKKPAYFWPCLPAKRFNTGVGKFLDPEYFKEVRDANGRGQVHPGQDINGNGGGDTDLGAAVHAVTDGVIMHALEHRVWGNIIVIYHPGPRVWSQYAHLDTMTVQLRDHATAGEVIGTIGKGGKDPAHKKGRFLAHLHFEIRTVDVPADEWPSVFLRRLEAEKYCRKTRADPVAWLAKVKASTTLP